jgi:hypothetical protein
MADAGCAADVRSISNLVTHLVLESLKRRRIGPEANPRERRSPYAIPLYLTAAGRKRLEARARAERRSLSGYVARVIAAELARVA